MSNGRLRREAAMAAASSPQEDYTGYARAMLENAPINVIFADRDLRIRYLNPRSVETLRRIAKYLPCKAEDVLGQCIDIFHAQPEMQRRLLADPRSLPHRAVIAVGPEKLDLLVSAIHDDAGRYVGAMLTWDVVTEKLALEARAADCTAQLEAIGRTQAVIEFAMDGTILTANANFLATMGYTLDEIRGKHHSMFVDETYRQSADYREFWASLNRGDFQSANYKRFGKGGKEVWIQAAYNPVLDADGKPVKVAKYATDITAAMQQKLATSQAVAQTAETLASSAEELTAVSQQISGNAEETLAQMNVVSSAAEQVSQSVQTVATATDEMTASITEIAKNAAEAARVATRAVEAAETTNATVSRLGDSSTEIGKVIKVITSIAQQTNLLALNATIEAARAGEAGKGFAVVANEVKELAKETAKATEEISQKIEAIQTDVGGAVGAIGEIGAIITQINDIASTIAGAVEEQAASTKEVARNVGEAARGSSEIAQNISGVAEAAQSTSQGAGDAQKAAVELSRVASELQVLVSQSRD